jgi:hypothetical protein
MPSKPLATRLREKRNRPPEGEPWVWLTRELIESDAWRTAPIQTIRFVFRVMEEHMAHGGTENGKLICTADQCVAWGIRRSAVTDAQHDAATRGLVYRSETGCFAPKRGRRPNRFGLGWLPAHDGSAAPNLWKRYHRAPNPTQDIKSSTTTRDKIDGGKRRERSLGFLNKVSPPGTVLVPPLGTEKMNSALPPGWKYGKVKGHVRAMRPGTPGRPWIGVPIIDGVGDELEQQARAELKAWKGKPEC